MLTIKHINQRGIETLLEAERIRVVRNRGRFEDGIFLDPDDGNGMAVIDGSRAAGSCSSMIDESAQLPPLPDGAAMVKPWVPDTFKHVIHFVDACSSDDTHRPTVYVMNRFGATVATYRLTN